MSIVDVDSHWEKPKLGTPEQRVKTLVGTVTADLLADVPPEKRPSIDVLTPKRLVEVFGRTDGSSRITDQPGSHDIPGRLAWCDKVGIDFQFINAGGFTGVELAVPDPSERRAAIRRSNDMLLDELDGHADRFAAVATVDLTDLDSAITELERCRARGSRAYHVRTEPPGGRSYAHPDFDRLWAATVGLGMVPYVHIGNTPSHYDPGWSNTGLGLPDAAGPQALMRLGQVARNHSVEVMLSALAFGGIFARYPSLTVLVAELGAGWLPFLLTRIDRSTDPHRPFDSDLMLGPWPHELSAGDYLRRNVRVTPLPSQADGMPTLRELPEMVVFSSDYPHIEGSATPLDDLAGELNALEPGVRKAFLGDTMCDVFERMGDPLPVRRGAEV